MRRCVEIFGHRAGGSAARRQRRRYAGRGWRLSACRRGAIVGSVQTNEPAGTRKIGNHRNANAYKTLIPEFPNLGNLHDRINSARADWHGKLGPSSVTVPIDNGSSPSATTQIVFATINEDTNVKLVVTNPYHQRGTAAFNRFNGMLTSMSGPDRQARACRAIGQMLGVQPKNTLTDCMDQDSVATPTVGNASIQKVRDFYDPVASLAGTAVQAAPSLHGGSSYSINAGGIGHDLTSLNYNVDSGGCNPVFDDPDDVRSVGAPRNTTFDNTAWQAAAMTVAARYPDALGIEIGNEVNTAGFWGGCVPDVLRYSQLLSLAYAGINSSGGNPSTPVITAGLAPGKQQSALNYENQGPYIKRMYWVEYLAWLSLLGASTSSDVVGLHPYRPSHECGGDTSDDRSVEESARAQIRFAKDRSTNGIPGLSAAVWVTEVGASTTGESAADCRRETFAGQANVLAGLHSVMRQENVPVAVFHSYRDYSAYTGSQAPIEGWEMGTGVATVSDGGPSPLFEMKPSYCRMMTVRGYARPPC